MDSVREPIPGHTVVVCSHPEAAAQEAARRLSGVLSRGSGRRRLVLAGGSTPKVLYGMLAGQEWDSALPWEDLWLTFSDERCVPPDHRDSNYAMLEQALLAPRGLGPHQILRFRGEVPPERAADLVHRELSVLSGRLPLFDAALLGLGSDGHTASIFPNSIPETYRWAAAARHPQDGSSRVTLTPRALRSTRETFFLVTGESKAEAVRNALGSEAPSAEAPARLAAERAVWILDSGAARQL